MPNGRRQVPCAREMPSRNSAADSSSQCTDNLFCGGGGDGACAHTMDAQKALMESSRVLCKGSSVCVGLGRIRCLRAAILARSPKPVDSGPRHSSSIWLEFTDT